MKKVTIRFLTLCMATLMLFGIMAGCGTTGTNDPTTAVSSQAQSTAAPKQDPVKIHYGVFPGHGLPSKDSPVIKKVEEMFNCQLEFWFNDTAEGANIRLASGEMPDVLMDAGNFIKWLNSGIIAPIDEKVVRENAPTYTSMIDSKYSDAWDFSYFDGRMYGIPTISYDGNYPTVALWNKTWLNNVGMAKVPETLAEFEEAFRRFRNDDPDKNGKKDTYGLSDFGIPGVLGAFGYPGFYSVDHLIKSDPAGSIPLWIKDGDIHISAIDPSMKDALALLQRWYKEELLDPEFITSEHTTGHWAQSQAFINQRIGYTGMAMFYHWRNELDPNNPNDQGGPLYAEFKQLQPNNEIAFGKPPVGPTGKSGTPAWSIIGQNIVFTTNARKDPRILETIAKLVEKNATDFDFYLLTMFGIEGTDWEKGGNGLPVSKHTDWKSSDFNKAGLNVMNASVIVEENVKKLDPFKYEFGDKVGIMNGYRNIRMPGKPAWVKYAPSLSKLVTEYYMKIITGEYSVDKFDEFVAAFKANGGDEVYAELREQYATMSKR